MIFNYILTLIFGCDYRAGTATRYTLDQKIAGHRSGVFVISATTSGSILASGGKFLAKPTTSSDSYVQGKDGIKIFDMKEHTEVQQPADINTVIRQISAIRWITGAEDPWETLCFGNGQGWLKIWRQNVRMVSRVCAFWSHLINKTSIVLKKLCLGNSLMVVKSPASLQTEHRGVHSESPSVSGIASFSYGV
jgi:hypothetical protein